MRKHTLKISYVGVAAAVLLGTVGIAPANASNSFDPIESILNAAPEVLKDSITSASVDLNRDVVSRTSVSTGASVELSAQASAGVTLKSSDGTSISIGLPSTDKKPVAKKVRNQVAYDNRDGSTTVPVTKSDGSVQITTVLADASAPLRYEYALGLPEGTRLNLDSSGSVSILNNEGVFVGGVLPAWAKDANGESVATNYEVSENKLVQVVTLSGNEVFPVVADPWLGIGLIDKVVKTTDAGKGARYLVYPTVWGRGGAGIAARWAAWGEAAEKGVPRTATLENQFLCHYDARPVTTFKSSWNLEAYTADKGYFGFVGNMCN
ncbi:DUF2599 domain-containing protein [Arthrobacter glacialis]|uniref:DUF2599 domain-containing protein n=1 Tax=Arthrobacter glacialis TaxID=1664 RepID=UPI000CD3B52F|nr:DUF2599 domain-containing protein [Arthrobacter glacialis]POH60300.1 hypothetical protein CVS28_05060 [Arthrobacter glacialis]